MKKNKLFVIGYNKTGTTSMEAVLKSLGYKMHHQDTHLIFIKDWAIRDFSKIIDFCKTADAFQDIPFSLADTYIAMDKAFPGSKFILTIRKDKDEWYNSRQRFFKKIFGQDRLPTAEEIKNIEFIYKGAVWDFLQAAHGIDENTLYDYDILTSNYEKHNREILNYFKDRPQDLLVINVADEDTIQKIYTFLGHEYNGEKMPHLNATK